DWLGLCAGLIDQDIVVRTDAIKSLTPTLRTTLDVAAEDVHLAFGNAAIVARLATICTPVLVLLAVANPSQDFAADTKCRRDSVFCHGYVHRPNENSDPKICN